MELSKLDLILMNIDTTASFKSFGSKTELNGEKCDLLNKHIKKLEKTKNDIKEYLVNMSVIADTNTERQIIVDILKILKESELEGN